MPPRPSPHPTDAEMEILVLLWRDGALTAGEVRDQLVLRRRTGYTTALKLLQTMRAKKLVRRDESERAHRYAAAVSEQVVQAAVVKTLVGQLFGGSVSQLVLRAISSTPTSPAERAEIQLLLDGHNTKPGKKECRRSSTSAFLLHSGGHCCISSGRASS